MEILTNRFDHRRPYEGDHGVRFEMKPNISDFFKKQITEVLDKL